MQQRYKQKLIILPILSTFLSFNILYGQALTIDSRAPRVEFIRASDTLSGNTYNYVRVPELIGIDSVKADGIFIRLLRLGYSIGIDAAAPPVPPKSKQTYSTNDGASWVMSSTDVRLGSIIKKKNGQLLSLDFVPVYGNPLVFPLNYYTSSDNGATWTTHTDGSVIFKQAVSGIRMHKNMLEEPDGSLYTCAYIRFSSNISHTSQSFVLKSVDGGIIWKPIYDSKGNPVSTSGNYSTDEGTITRCPDGSWLTVMKQHVSHPYATIPMLMSKSTDKGQSWSTPTQLQGLSPKDSRGKNPCLALMPNGVVVLSWGTPDVSLAFSVDNGITWTNLVKTFLDPGGNKQPSGNTWVLPTSQNTILQFGDNYARTLNPNTQAIWQKELEVVRPEQNRIDLKTKYEQGKITVSALTTLTSKFTNHPEARPVAAFDGGTSYWSSAMGTNSGVYELDLQQPYNIKTIGVALLYGVKESAVVELSLDGTRWIPVKSYTNTIHYCLNYTTFNAVQARYVRVKVNGAGQIGLGELELYSTASTFENNAAETIDVNGILPTGYVPNGTSPTQYGVSVVRGGYGYQSDRALKLYDNSSTWQAGVKKIVAAGNAKTLEFRCRPAAMPPGSSVSWQIRGTVAGVENIVFYFAVFSDGKIKANNGSGWKQIGTATLPVSSTNWKLIRVEADEFANSATLYVDNKLMGTTVMYADPARTTNLTGFAFNSNGIATSGELIYFDDVDFYDTKVRLTQ